MHQISRSYHTGNNNKIWNSISFRIEQEETMKLIYEKLLNLCAMVSVVSILGIILNPDMRSKMIITLSLSIIGAIVVLILMKNEKE
jgi:hypothetical protein